MKKIIGLSCGRKNGNNESFIKEAAMGAEEFGVETEIIRAMELNVKPCNGCRACTESMLRGDKNIGCTIKDDVSWILEKTVLEDAGLIVAVPVYYLRSNGYFMCISERMHPLMWSHKEILKKTKVGAIISVGGTGEEGWASLGLLMVNIWVQHHRKLVDQIQVNLAFRHEIDWYARVRELGRNVARAMMMPIEKVEFVGEETAVSCPVCHCNIMYVPEDLPDVYCPICWVHGVISSDGGKMKVEWNEWDIEHPRFSEWGVLRHMGISPEGQELRKKLAPMVPEREILKQLREQYSSYGKIIRPPSKT